MRCFSPASDIEIYTFSFQPIDSRMYILTCGEEKGSAVVIDPCESHEALDILRREGVEQVTVLLTHEHYDHISGVNLLRKNFPCMVICNEFCGRAVQDPAKNLSKYFTVLFVAHPQEVQELIQKMDVQPYACAADRTFSEEYSFNFGHHMLTLKTTPGHTKGSICISVDEWGIFTGDTLLRTVPVLRKPGGDRKVYMEKTLPWLTSQNPDMMVYPGHGEPGNFKEMYLHYNRERSGK